MKGWGRVLIWLGLLCALAGCGRPKKVLPSPAAKPTETVSPTPTAEPTEALSPTPAPEVTAPPEDAAPVPVRSREGFASSGEGNWGERTFTAGYEDEYGPYFSIDVTLPWAAGEGEGYAAIDRRFAEWMEEYKATVWEAYAPEERPPACPSLLVRVDSLVETKDWVSFRFLRNDYSGGAHGGCTAWAETYDTTSGERLGFEDFFSDPEEAEERIQEEIQRQVEADRETYGWLFEEHRAAPGVISPFDRELVYPVEGGFEVFYQWYSIGGHLQGAPTFFIDRALLEDVTALSEEEPAPELWGQRKLELYDYREGRLMLEYSAVLPVARENGKGFEAINGYYPDLNDLMTEAEEYSHLTDEVPVDLPGLPFCMHYGLVPTFEGGGLVQMSGGSYWYSGGAHPGHSQYSDCFDLATGERLELAALFTDWEAAKEVIWTAIEPQIRECRPAELLEYSLKWAREDLEKEPVFFLDDEGLTIHYNEYAIASYVEGSFDFFVPGEELAGLTRYPIWENDRP